MDTTVGSRHRLKYPGTVALIVVNTIVFAIMAVHLQSIFFDRGNDLIYMLSTGANFNPYTVGGDFWRLFTSMFMHGGILHLAVNMLALLSLGRMLEPVMGPSRFLLMYMITGLVGGLASLEINLFVISVGASGAIFGIYGYSLMRQVLANYRDRRMLINILVNFGIFVAINFWLSTQFPVDNAAHIGGAIAGLLMALLHGFGMFTGKFAQAFVVLVLPLVVFVLPPGQRNYFGYFQEVVKVENRLQAINNQLLTDAQRADSLRLLLPQYDSVRGDLDSLKNIPEEVAGDTAIIKKYLSYRIGIMRFKIREMDEETFVYIDSVDALGRALDSLPSIRYNLNYTLAQRPAADSRDSAVAATEWVKVQYDSGWRETENSEIAEFYRLGRRDTLGRWQGPVQDFYGNGRIQMKGAYLDDKHHGVFRYYSREGRYESLGRYDSDRPVGKWEEYHPNGRLKSVVYYGNGSFTRSIYDSLGKAMVEAGEGRYVEHHANGVVAEEGEYRNGRRQGDWFGYYPSGEPHFRERYQDGLLMRGESRTPEGEKVVYDQMSIFPFPEMGEEAYRQYLRRQVLQLDNVRGHSGVVKLVFTVDADGALFDFVVRESLCVPCDSEAIRMVKEGPPWRPGVLRGHLQMRSNGYVEVVF